MYRLIVAIRRQLDAARAILAPPASHLLTIGDPASKEPAR